MSQHTELHQLLLEIEAEMRAWSLWSAHAPSAQALQSRQPFCIDSLSFWEWVQWVMLPKFRQMVAQQMPLPQGSNILPMAEEIIINSAVKSCNLIDLFREIDQLLNARH